MDRRPIAELQNPTLAQIRERAYELWERNHRPDGLEAQLWLAAERELRAEMRADPPRDGPTTDADSGAEDQRRHARREAWRPGIRTLERHAFSTFDGDTGVHHEAM